MTVSARDYLLGRFRTDGATLRQRAKALDSGVASAGPNAATSRRMADACDDVVVMLEHLAARAADTNTREPDLDDIAALAPALELRAAAEAAMPPVRAVYVGAATRIREILAAELSAAPSNAFVDDQSDDATDDRDDVRDEDRRDEDRDEDRDDDDIVWPTSNEPRA